MQLGVLAQKSRELRNVCSRGRSREEINQRYLRGVNLVPLQKSADNYATHAVADENDVFVFLKNLVVTKNESHVLYQFVDGVTVTDIRARVGVNVHVRILKSRVIGNHLWPICAAIGICPCPHGTAENTMHEYDYGVGVLSTDVAGLSGICARFDNGRLFRVARIHETDT